MRHDIDCIGIQIINDMINELDELLNTMPIFYESALCYLPTREEKENEIFYFLNQFLKGNEATWINFSRVYDHEKVRNSLIMRKRIVKLTLKYMKHFAEKYESKYQMYLDKQISLFRQRRNIMQSDSIISKLVDPVSFSRRSIKDHVHLLETLKYHFESLLVDNKAISFQNRNSDDLTLPSIHFLTKAQKRFLIKRIMEFKKSIDKLASFWADGFVFAYTYSCTDLLNNILKMNSDQALIRTNILMESVVLELASSIKNSKTFLRHVKSSLERTVKWKITYHEKTCLSPKFSKMLLSLSNVCSSLTCGFDCDDGAYNLDTFYFMSEIERNECIKVINAFKDSLHELLNNLSLTSQERESVEKTIECLEQRIPIEDDAVLFRTCEWIDGLRHSFFIL